MHIWAALAPQSTGAKGRHLKTPASSSKAEESHFSSSNRGRVCAQDLRRRPQRRCWLQSEPIGPLKKTHTDTHSHTRTRWALTGCRITLQQLEFPNLTVLLHHSNTGNSLQPADNACSYSWGHSLRGVLWSIYVSPICLINVREHACAINGWGVRHMTNGINRWLVNYAGPREQKPRCFILWHRNWPPHLPDQTPPTTSAAAFNCQTRTDGWMNVAAGEPSHSHRE